MDKNNVGKKKNSDLAALLNSDATDIEKKVTGTEKDLQGATPPPKPPEAPLKAQEAINSSESEEEDQGLPEAKEEPKTIYSTDQDLPKSFTRVFVRNSRYEKEPKTTTLVYRLILDKYSKVSAAMDVDTVVLINNVLAEWYNKHLDPVDKVVNQKADIKPL